MSRREVDMLQGVFEAILTDYLDAYPSDATEVERDVLRLSLVASTRGLGFFLLDLPALGKHFDKCLSSGFYVAPALPLGTNRWPTSPIPRFLSGLVIRVFERDSGRLRSDADVTVIAFLRQLYYFAKGYRRDCSTKRAEKAIAEFFEVDREVRPSTLNWGDDCMDFSRLDDLSFDHLAYNENSSGETGFPATSDSARQRTFARALHFVCDIVATQFGVFSHDSHRARHGPGAVSDLKADVTKYSFPSWSDKLDQVFPYADLAFIDHMHWVDESDRPCINHEQPSRLLMVPKTAKGPRLIASESVSHQWCQQIILAYLNHGIQNSILKSCISLKDQNPSRDMVLKASHNRSHATIDLSAASDRVSCWFVERAFRRNKSLLRALHASRTRSIINGTSIGEWTTESFALAKFSTMGSACTFPIQSILFAMVCIATLLSEENHNWTLHRVRKISRTVRVFGDDIIIPTDHFDAVCRNLSVLGLKVNDTKSFSEGHFRESCGMDAWGGFDITPARLNCVPNISRPTSLMSTVDASNNFYLKGYWRTAAYIESTIPQWVRKHLPVVASDCGSFGLISHSGEQYDHLRSRWNASYQRVEVKVTRIKSRVIRCLQTGIHDLFQYFTERPAPDTHWEPGRVRDSSEYLTLGWESLTSITSRLRME
jgi:hypothetical protein